MVFFHVKSWHIVGFRVGQLHPFFWWICTADVQRSNAVHFHWLHPGNGSPKNYESWVNPLDLWGKCCTGKRKHDAGEDERMIAMLRWCCFAKSWNKAIFQFIQSRKHMTEVLLNCVSFTVKRTDMILRILLRLYTLQNNPAILKT